MIYFERKSALLACSLFFSLLLTGCVSPATNPISSIATSSIDEQILGTWHVEDNASEYVHIKKSTVKNQIMIKVVSKTKDNSKKIDQYTGFTSRLSGNTYLNVNYIHDNQKKMYYFVKYYFKNNKLYVSLIDAVAVKKAVVDGQVKGTLMKSKHSDSTVISASSEELQKFIYENDKKLFKEFHVMTKQK